MTCPRNMAVSRCGTRYPTWPPQDCFTAGTTSLPCLHSLLAPSQELFEWAEGLLSRALKIYTLRRHQMKPTGALCYKHLFSCPRTLHGAWSKISAVEHEAAENKVRVRVGGSLCFTLKHFCGICNLKTSAHECVRRHYPEDAIQRRMRSPG